MTFAEATRLFLQQHEAKWRSPIHARQWTTSLHQYVLPVLGQIDVKNIDTSLVLKVIEPLWVEKTETASRLRGRIENILGWATVRGHRSGDNPARWRNHLDKVLPARAKVAPTEHHQSLPYEDLPAFMARLANREDIAGRRRFTNGTPNT